MEVVVLKFEVESIWLVEYYDKFKIQDVRHHKMANCGGRDLLLNILFIQTITKQLQVMHHYSN